MRTHISELLISAVSGLQTDGDLPADINVEVCVTRSKDKAHGDFACNLALQLSKATGMAARQLAEKIAARVPEDATVTKIEVAGPGFLNFYLRVGYQVEVLNQILETRDGFGTTREYSNDKVQIEFVSANPTGPLHVGHGRGAAYGATIGNLLEAVGYNVHREYYMNDAGRQMDILTVSVWLRYLELCGETLTFPDNAYQGDYVWDVAAALHRQYGNQFNYPVPLWGSQLSSDGDADQEAYIDALIDKAQELLGENDYNLVAKHASDTISSDIKDDLELFGVRFDNWYSERSLANNDKVRSALDALTRKGHTYNKDGALWFRSSAFGDEKDRVLVRGNGQTTYFASDVAYHLEKFRRGFDQLIDIWGADHHGYIARVRAAIEALGEDPKRLRVLLVQFANLYTGGKKLAMSTRSGEFVTLRQLRKQVGKDAARFFYVMRKCEQHLDFDLDLATSQTQDNPVYYVQYAHARICSVFSQAANRYGKNQLVDADAALLTQEQEQDLVTLLDQFPERVVYAADQLAPHVIVNYLRDLANAFHSFYNACQVLVDDAALRGARLKLIGAIQIVLRNGLALLNVNAPEHM